MQFNKDIYNDLFISCFECSVSFLCFLWMSWIWFTRSLPLNANYVTVGCILRSTNNKEKKQMLWKNKCFNFSVWSTLFTKLKCAITLARDTLSLHFDRVRNFNENVIKFINSSICARLERKKNVTLLPHKNLFCVREDIYM